jgi:hypothetical protein
MLKKKFASFFVLAALFSVVLGAQETKSITTEIQGIVPLIFSLNTDMTDVETVDLVNADSAYLGKVVVYTNSRGIWTIVIKSTNLGKLKGLSVGNPDVYPYIFAFGGVEDIDLGNPFKITYSTLLAKTTVEYPISIRYKKLEELEDPVRPDTYSDIVTITVTVS